MRALLLTLLLVATPLAQAYPDPDKVPGYFESGCFGSHSKRFVHDYLGMIPAEYGTEMEGAACDVHLQTSAHFVLVTTKDTEGETLENYALHLFEEWGIGDHERHDGILMLYVADHLGSGEPALRIEVGYGLEGVINSFVTEDAWDLMIDARDRALEAGETESSARVFAMATGMLYLLGVIQDGYTEAGFPAPRPASGLESPRGQLIFNIVVIILVILVLAYLASRANGRRGWGYHGPTSPGWQSRSARVWVPSSGGFGGGGFGGGGSFGGGRSGGGGRGGKF